MSSPRDGHAKQIAKTVFNQRRGVVATSGGEVVERGESGRGARCECEQGSQVVAAAIGRDAIDRATGIHQQIAGLIAVGAVEIEDGAVSLEILAAELKNGALVEGPSRQGCTKEVTRRIHHQVAQRPGGVAGVEVVQGGEDFVVAA